MSKLRKAFLLFLGKTPLYGKTTVKLVGQDHLGNKYYESFNPQSQRKVHRYFDKEDINNFDSLVGAANVPPCWDAWLRFRRKEPPTQQELEDSEEYFRMQQQKAADRKQKEKENKVDKSAEHDSFTISDEKKQRRKVPPDYYEKLS